MEFQNNVERFNHWMAEIVQSQHIYKPEAMCHARAIVASHQINSLKNQLNIQQNENNSNKENHFDQLQRIEK